MFVPICIRIYAYMYTSARGWEAGPSVVVCKTVGGKVCGGYNPKGWVGYGEARGSIAAFLFVKERDETIKLIKVGGPSLSQIDNPENGPSFGKSTSISNSNALFSHPQKEPIP